MICPRIQNVDAALLDAFDRQRQVDLAACRWSKLLWNSVSAPKPISRVCSAKPQIYSGAVSRAMRRSVDSSS